MIYSQVVSQRLILPRKRKYTMADVDSVMAGSLFRQTGTYSRNEAAFIVKCSAIFHGTDYSKAVGAVQGCL